MDNTKSYEEILQFWFDELSPQQHFQVSDSLDQLITERFSSVHKAARLAELFAWRESARGSLAEIIVLDQFSRNMFRNAPMAFAQDAMALVLAQEAITKGFHRELEGPMKAFLYMPFMHSESVLIHEKAMELFSEKGLEHNLDFEIKHKKIIDTYGRYPHRNSMLGRESTTAEKDYLINNPKPF